MAVERGEWNRRQENGSGEGRMGVGKGNGLVYRRGIGSGKRNGEEEGRLGMERQNGSGIG